MKKLSKSFTYVLLVIMVYLLIIFPKMVGKSESGKTEETEETTSKKPSGNAGIIGGVAGDILAGKYTL